MRLPQIRHLSGSHALTTSLVVFHALSALLTILRPNLVELLPGYGGFARLMPTESWGTWMALTALGLVLSRQGSLARVIAQASSVLLLTLFAVLVSAISGLNWGTVAYGTFALGSLIVMGETAEEWFLKQKWYQRLQEKRHV